MNEGLIPTVAHATKAREVVVPARPKPIEVPLSLRAAAELVEKRREGNTDHDPDFDAMLDASAAITNAAEKTRATVSAIMANQMATPIKNAAAARDAANKIFKSVAVKLDGARRRVETELMALTAKTAPPAPRDAIQALHHQEIRKALLRLPQAERSKAVEAAITEGDDMLVAAAVIGSPLLTGLGKAEAAALANAWRRQRHSDTMGRIDRLRNGLEEFNRISSLLSGWSLSLFNEQDAAVVAAQESERLAQAAMSDLGGKAVPQF
jgi:hypothetical protein